MRYLYIMEDGSTSQTNDDPTNEDCEYIGEGTLTLIRFEKGAFQAAVSEGKDVPDNEDDEDSDTHEEWSITDWIAV